MTRRGASVAAAIAILMPLGFAPADAQTIAVFTKSQGNPVARSIRIGAETYARAEKAMVFNFIPTSADNVAQQTALAEEALRSKPDAVVFTPTDVKAMVPVVGEIHRRRNPGDQRQRPSRRRQCRRLCRQRRRGDRARDRAAHCSRPWEARAPSSSWKGRRLAIERAARARLQRGAQGISRRQAPGDGQRRTTRASPAADVMNGFVRKFQQIDGVLAANDPMAAGALDALGPSRAQGAGGRHQRQPRLDRPDQVGCDARKRRLQRFRRGLHRRRARAPRGTEARGAKGSHHARRSSSTRAISARTRRRSRSAPARHWRRR